MNQGAGFRSSHPSPSISRLFLSWNRDVFTLIRDYYLERVCCLSVEGWCLIHHLLSLSVSASCRLFCENPPKRFFGKYRFSNGFHLLAISESHVESTTKNITRLKMEERPTATSFRTSHYIPPLIDTQPTHLLADLVTSIWSAIN